MSFNFMAVVTICSDFGAPQNKVCQCFHCFLIYLPWSDKSSNENPMNSFWLPRPLFLMVPCCCCCCCVASVVFDSVRPHGRQPTRLPHPWDSPGKNTGVGCHSLLQCMKVKSESEVAQSCLTPSDPMDCTGLLCPWDLPGKSTGVGCHCLLHMVPYCKDSMVKAV